MKSKFQYSVFQYLEFLADTLDYFKKNMYYNSRDSVKLFLALPFWEMRVFLEESEPEVLAHR